MMRPIECTEIADAIERSGVVAVIRLKDGKTLPGVVEALMAGGVQALEITMTVPGAIEMIASLAPTLPAGFLLGAGTVTDAETTRRVVDAGAQFVVSPVLGLDVIDAGHRQRVPVLPGCFSPTEIFTAWEAGADIVKVFPATALGPAFFKDVHGPLPDVKLMPTGGVTIENAAEWIRAGAVAVGVGGALLDGAAIAAGRFDVITANARRLVQSVEQARKGR